jgi:hypothetical protein
MRLQMDRPVVETNISSAGDQQHRRALEPAIDGRGVKRAFSYQIADQVREGEFGQSAGIVEVPTGTSRCIIGARSKVAVVAHLKV